MTNTVAETEAEIAKLAEAMRAMLEAAPDALQAQRLARASIGMSQCVVVGLLLEWVAKDIVPARLAQGMMREVRISLAGLMEKAGCSPDTAAR